MSMTMFNTAPQQWGDGAGQPGQQNWPGFPGPPWGWSGGHGPGCHCGHCPPPQECWPPACPPQPGWDWNWRPPFGAIRGPIIGVTDGSFANPGEVGEYIHGTSTLTITAAQSGVPQFVAPLVIPPGDWTVTLTAGANFVMQGFNASLDPVPPGIRIPGEAAFVELDMAPGVLNAYTGQRTFALSNAQPQLITVNVHAQGITSNSFDANDVAGQITAVIIVDARRVR